MKNENARQEPGKIYHMSNVTGKEVNYMQANERARPCFIDKFSCESFMANRTGLDGTIQHLPGSTASYGKYTQSRTFKNQATFLTHLAN